MFEPFDKMLSQLVADDLESLGRVTEGWYVEYKRDVLSAERLAKSLCAFANAEGGWLFLGISAGSDNTAGSFSGLDTSARASIEDRIRQAANAHCSRPPMFETRFIEGPSSKVNLAAGKFICVIRVPSSEDVPHVHSSGVIFRRVGSGSEPKPETDRALLDQLLARRKRLERNIKRFTKWRPSLGRNVHTTSVHIYLVPRRIGESPDPREIQFSEFPALLNEGSGMRFDNFYTVAGGVVARSVFRSALLEQVHTIRYWHNGWAHLTLPVDSFSAGDSGSSQLRHLAHLREFEAHHAIDGRRIIDLTSLLFPLTEFMARYRRLLNVSNLRSSQVHARITIEGTGHRVPFVDMDSFPAFARAHGVAHVERDEITCPLGTGYAGLIMLDEPTDVEPQSAFYGFPDAAALFKIVAESVGIPLSFFSDHPEALLPALRRRIANAEPR